MELHILNKFKKTLVLKNFWKEIVDVALQQAGRRRLKILSAWL